jgi:outer membrane protein TolC
MKKKITYLPVLLALLASGCGALTGSSYERPNVQTPAMWSVVQGAGQEKASSWWTKFNDKNLNSLVDEVLAKNNNLAVAALKVKEARLRADLALDQYLPDVTGTATARNARKLSKAGTVTRTYTASVNASYEIDLWGKIASQKDSADWEAEATEQDRETAAIALIGTTADLYWKIAYLNERIALSEASIAYAKKALDIAKVQHAAGATSAIDEAAAEQKLATQEAAHTQYLQQRQEAMNAFDILFDGPPGSLKAEAAVLPKGEMPRLDANVPASLLERRPDLRAAEYRLRESLADTDATAICPLFL